MPRQPCAVIWPAATEAALARVAARNPRLAERIVAAVDRYAATGHGDVKRLQGARNLRLRVGTWRIIFDQEPGRIVVRAVDDRKDAYRS
jgi:mRNA interferase RelE/StbE